MPDAGPTDSGRRSIEALLEPRLAGSSASHGLYSTRASFFVAFFGGPFAILLFAGLNSQRLGRIAKDAPIFALAGLGVAGFVVWAAQHASATDLPGWLAALGEGRRGLRNLTRLLSLLLFGLVYAVHRRFHLAAQLRGDDPPSPWLPGIATTIVGAVLTFALVAGVETLSRG